MNLKPKLAQGRTDLQIFTQYPDELPTTTT